MTTEPLFLVLWPHNAPEPHEPVAVAWAFVEEHFRQVHANHGQSMTTLHRRGGLDVSELVAVLEDRPWRRMDWAEARARLLELRAEWRRRHGFAE